MMQTSGDEHDVHEIVLVRHGETEWSTLGRHTGRTDIPLNSRGRVQAESLRERLRGRRFALVLTSPLRRASATCELAGFGKDAEPCPDLMEWDYGAYEGRTTEDIRVDRLGWTLWTDSVPEGESAGDVAARAARVLAEIRRRAHGGDALLFGHGHALRVLTACWLELPPERGALFALNAGALCTLGYEHEAPVVRSWNDTCHL
jgi:probable phosphoglycerate mutase